MRKQNDLYTQFTAFVESKGLMASTREQYLRQIRHLARYYPGKPLEHITERQIAPQVFVQSKKFRVGRIR